MSLKLLAKVPGLDETTKEACGWDVTRITRNGQPVMREARFPYFRDGFVDIDLPRSVEYTVDINKATKGYAVADENGVVLGEFKSINAAEKARAGAKVKLVVETPEIELDDDPGAPDSGK